MRDGAEIAPGELAAERSDYGQVVLPQRLRDALARLNPSLSTEALEDALPQADTAGRACCAKLGAGRGARSWWHAGPGE